MTMLDDLIKAKDALEKLKPKTVEIWTMEIMPSRDDKGDPVIVKINPKELTASAYKGIAMIVPSPQIKTVTGADEIIMMHPDTFSMLQSIPEFYEMVSGMYPIPVFDDAYRRQHWRGQQTNTLDK